MELLKKDEINFKEKYMDLKKKYDINDYSNWVHIPGLFYNSSYIYLAKISIDYIYFCNPFSMGQDKVVTL